MTVHSCEKVVTLGMELPWDGGGEVKKSEKIRDVIYGRPLVDSPSFNFCIITEAISAVDFHVFCSYLQSL